MNIVDIEEPKRPTVTARYGGTCASCGERYDIDEEITFSDEDEGWVCGWCA